MSAPTKRFWKSLADIDWEIKRLEQEIQLLEKQRRRLISVSVDTTSLPKPITTSNYS